jgi:hypothetical protein
MLLLGGPGDQVRAQKDSTASCGALVVRVTCPIRVAKTSEGECSFGVMKAGIYYSFQVTKNTLSSCLVTRSGSVHVLIELVDSMQYPDG